MLVVEDDVAVRFLMGVVLGEDLGARVVEAASGPDAVAAAAQAQPSLVILDLMLPGFDGVEVLRRLRADPATRDIPVVAMSAAAGGSQALAEGRAAFLQKPFDLDDVVAAARQALIPRVAGGSPDPLRVVRAVGTERRAALRARVAACRSAGAAAHARLAAHRAGTRAVLAAVRQL